MQRTRLITPLVGAAAAFLSAPLAFGQGFNMDLNTAAGTPTSSYGAASGQVGSWNALGTSVPLGPVTLNDLSGAASSVTLEIGPGANGYNGLGPYNYNCSGTSGDDEALVDDILDVGGGFPQAPSGILVTVKGLAANTYDIYTYSYAPDNELPGNGGYPWITVVDVIGSPTGQQQVGTVLWPATGHVLGETYARHTITIPAGTDLVIQLDSDISAANPGSYGSLNGIQIVEAGSGVGNFCTSRPSSLPNCTPTLTGSSGTVSKSGSPAYGVVAAPAPGGGGKPGILIYTKNGLLASPANTPFGELCLNQFLRAGAFPSVPGGSTGTCDGSYVWDFAAVAAFYGQIAAGDTLHVQAWYRDPSNPGTANFTEGIGPITVTP